MNNCIMQDGDGNVFISFSHTEETLIAAKHKPLTHCLAVVRLNSDYLLGYNRWRNRYEIFGGCIEENESPRNCITRECFEELGIIDGGFTYLGVMKFLMKPDYFSSDERIEYGVLYGITLPNVAVEDVFEQISDRDEISRLALYSEIKGREPIADIDEKLLDYYK